MSSGSKIMDVLLLIAGFSGYDFFRSLSLRTNTDDVSHADEPALHNGPQGA